MLKPSLSFVLCVVALMWMQTLFANGTQLKDPTRPLDYHASKAAVVDFELQSILIGKGRTVAIINGKQVQENDTINNARVVEITRNSVTLQQGGRRWQLNLHGDDLRK